MQTTGSGSNDFQSLARQYWQAWGGAMRQGGAPMPGNSASGLGAQAMPGWQDAVDWWSRIAQGSNPQADDVLQRFNAQARDWYGAMQQVAARFSGQDTGAADISAEWKRALGGMGENPFPDMFKAMRGDGAQGLDQWIEAAKPYLDSMRSEGASWLGIPAFGLGREQQERMQALARAQIEYQQCDAAYNALMLKAVQRAHEVFADKLAAHEEPGRQLTSARALFDLWIDAAEEAYADIALSREFRETYGALVNAQMRLRQGVQRQVEQAGAMLGMPTRTELDGAHRKLAELERVVRRLRDSVARIGTDSSASGKPGVDPKQAPGNGNKPVEKKKAVKNAEKKSSKKTAKKAPKKAPKKAAKELAAGKHAAKRAAAKPAANKSATSRKARKTVKKGGR